MRHTCGYRVLVEASRSTEQLYIDGEPDSNLCGEEIRYCPGCLRRLAPDGMLSEGEYQAIEMHDDWEAVGTDRNHTVGRGVKTC